jgi:uncharacterized protein YcsI (UPF0317 family)
MSAEPSKTNQETPSPPRFEDLRQLSAAGARRAFRAGGYSGHTAGIGLGYLQGNLAILPADYALDFARYCQRNPRPCPLVGFSDTGSPYLPDLGADLDIRSDLPLYNVYRDGELSEQVPDIRELWRDDLVAFVIGCSFSFEEALMAEGIRLRHIEQDRTVSMYRTAIETVAAGPFSGEMVVSMRPMNIRDAIRAVEIAARFPKAHGAPIHIGDPGEIGIADLGQPEWGDPSEIAEDELAVFWACGVTAQVALRKAAPPLCITHAPGRMLITDIPSWDVDSTPQPIAVPGRSQDPG